ncbi:MAG: NUDIX hydrolase [Patescibacteria group bacterium]
MKEENRFKLCASTHIFFIKGNEILLLLRKNVTSDGYYSVVAGHLEGGETVTQATIREAKEEINVDIREQDIEIRTVCHSYSSHNDREFIQFFVVCREWQGEIINNEPHKCGGVKFFPISNLPSNMVPYVRKAIEKVFADVRYYEEGWRDSIKNNI